MLRDLWGECATGFVCKNEGTWRERERERGALHMALALSETVAAINVHRI
jgi:hypothetical protein